MHSYAYNLGAYNGQMGEYQGTTATQTDQGVIKGEFIQVQFMSLSLNVTSFTISFHFDDNFARNRGGKSFTLVGCSKALNGTNYSTYVWDVIDRKNSISWGRAPQTFLVNKTLKQNNSFRFIIETTCFSLNGVANCAKYE